MKRPVLLTLITLITLAVGDISMSSAEKLFAAEESVTVQSANQFSSRYSALTGCGSGMTKQEEREAEKHGSDIPIRCKGFGGYDIDISYSACSSNISVEKGEENTSLAMQSIDWKPKTMEWRLAGGRPFAVILRVNEYAGNDQCATGGKVTGEFLVVKGLKGYEHIDERVDVKKTPNPNLKAREIADKGYARPKS